MIVRGYCGLVFQALYPGRWARRLGVAVAGNALRPAAWWQPAMLLAGGAAVGTGNFIYPYLSARDQLLVYVLAFSLPVSGLLWSMSASRSSVPRPAANGAKGKPADPLWLIAAFFVVTLITEAGAESWWPNSADEYGYSFLAQTLLHGRLWNPPPPAPLIFDVAWIYVRDGKWFSQYPPGWPALLAPFVAFRAGWLVNPLVTAGLGALVLRVFGRLQPDTALARPLAMLLMFSPFVVFNGASLFPHSLTALLVMLIVLLQSREEAVASKRNRLGIGAAFGALLLTRYDVFLLTAAPFVADRLWRRRGDFRRDLPELAAGGLPFAAMFLIYNRAITGRAFKTPYAWVSGGAHVGLWGKHVVMRDAVEDAVLRTAHWLSELAAFTSPLLIALVILAVAAKCRARTLRWHDALFPAAVGFFFLYPASGGHEFGPRYWFFAWPTAMLGVVTGLAHPSSGAGWLRAGKWRLHAPTLAAGHLAVFLGFALVTATFTHLYVDQRRLVDGIVPPRTPALVLIPARNIEVTRWQTVPIIAHSEDFARNGVTLEGPVLYARGDDHGHGAERFSAIACTLGRYVYRWRAPGALAAVACP